MSTLRILVPPSEGKTAGGRGPAWRPGTGVLPELDGARSTVLAALGDHDVASGPTRPAIERYAGVLYRELDWPSLPAGAKRRGRSSLLVVSGLWGVVAPPDPIPHYKLKMSASMPGLGRLSAWWRPRLSAALGEHLRGRTVWDLLPAEHAAAWEPSARRWKVRVVDEDGRTVGHWNKLVKGTVVRMLLTGEVTKPADLHGWTHPCGHRVEVERG